MVNGTDVIVVEKAGTVLKVVPFTKNVGIAFIQSQGFVSEYGIALAQLANHDYQASVDYTNGIWPKHAGHLGVLMDCDSSGWLIGMKIPVAHRIGINLKSIKEMIEVNNGLGLDFTEQLSMENLVESTKANSHWEGLKGVLMRNPNSKTYNALLSLGEERVEPIICKYQELLLEPVYDTKGKKMHFIDWLETNRIELNTILSAMDPHQEGFWNWLKWKLIQIWPDRNYNRVIIQPQPNEVYPKQISDFITRLDATISPLLIKRYTPITEQLRRIKWFIKDTDATQDLIYSRVSKQIGGEEKIKLLAEKLGALADEIGLLHKT
jgi:hypothetical protein